jgi:hypothetical protein
MNFIMRIEKSQREMKAEEARELENACSKGNLIMRLGIK